LRYYTCIIKITSNNIVILHINKRKKRNILIISQIATQKNMNIMKNEKNEKSTAREEKKKTKRKSKETLVLEEEREN
jgi:hypothetical protein